MHHLHTVILYHAKCIDGFGGAYAAWKKFGDTAEYTPVSYGKPAPEHLEGRDLIFIDFCYEQPQMDALKAIAQSIIVLDHHDSVQAVATAYPGTFDTAHSGATLSWAYFHPGEKMPELLRYIEDGDLYRYALPETEDIFSFLVVEPHDFERWDSIANRLETEGGRAELLAGAKAYNEYFHKLGDISVAGAKVVQFEGYEAGFAVTHPIMTMKSYVGHELCKKHPPIALVVSAHPDGFGVSIRGDGSVDVSAIARKYGGGGLRNSAGFFIPASATLPWQALPPTA